MSRKKIPALVDNFAEMIDKADAVFADNSVRWHITTNLHSLVIKLIRARLSQVN